MLRLCVSVTLLRVFVSCSLSCVTCVICLGHTRLNRITSYDREELKKKEKEWKKIKEEDELGKPIVWIKYSLGLKHQVKCYAD